MRGFLYPLFPVRKFLLLYSFFISFPALQSQVLEKVKLKEVKGTVDRVKNIQNLNDAAGFAKEKYIEYLKNHKNDFDKTDLNYAVSFSDNSGMFETEEKYGRMQKTLLYVMDPESMEKRTDIEKAADYNDAGELFYASGKFSMAQKSFETSKLLYEGAGMENSPQYSQVLSNLGLLFHTTGRYNTAEAYSREALMIREGNADDLKGMAASLNNLAVLYKDQGKYTEADELIRKAQEAAMKSEGNTSTAYAITLNNQAILYQITGKYDDAEKILKQALSVAGEELGKKSPNYIRMKINLALLYQLQKKYDASEKIFLDAIETKKRRLGTSHPDYAVLLQSLAALYLEKGNYNQVESNLNQALEIFKKKFGEQTPSVASVLFDLARYYQYRDEPDKALPSLNRALQIQLDNLGEHHPSYVNSLESLAILYWQKNDLKSASEKYQKVMEEYLYQIRHYFPAMSEYDKTRFWDKIGPRILRFYAFACASSSTLPEITGDMFTYRMATKAILLSSTNKVKKRILESSDVNLKFKYQSWLDLKEYISRLYTKSKEELKAENINLDSLENVANLQEKELSKLSETFAQGYENKLMDWKTLSSSLSTEEAAIEIIRFRNYKGLIPDTATYYAALIVKNTNSLPELVIIPNGDELESTIISEYRDAMQNISPSTPHGEMLWGKIQNATGNCKILYASLDGIYNQINLNTLQTGEGKFLIDLKNIRYVTNSKDIPDLKKRMLASTNPFGNKTACLIGNPHYALGMDWNAVKQMPLQELPGTALEIEKIQQLLKTQAWNISSYVYDGATEMQVKKIKQPAILHIATHGFFLEDLADPEEKVFGIEPMKAAKNPLLRSGLMFAGADNTIQQIGSNLNGGQDDGILNAYEAMLLGLDQTELVVLSACETGLGETKNGEGVYGLQRAFEMAGTKALIISLWEVSDEVTQKLMSSFYKNWLKGKDKQKAFIEAQQEIKTLHPEPFYWGAFIILGN